MLLLEVDASKVVAGWLPLGLVLLLGVAIALLYLNMRKHLRRGNELPTEADVREQRRAATVPSHGEPPDAPSDATAGTERSSTPPQEGATHSG